MNESPSGYVPSVLSALGHPPHFKPPKTKGAFFLSNIVVKIYLSAAQKIQTFALNIKFYEVGLNWNNMNKRN